MLVPEMSNCKSYFPQLTKVKMQGLSEVTVPNEVEPVPPMPPTKAELAPMIPIPDVPNPQSEEAPQPERESNNCPYGQV